MNSDFLFDEADPILLELPFRQLRLLYNYHNLEKENSNNRDKNISSLKVADNAIFIDLSRRCMWTYYLLGVFIFYVWYQATVNVMFEGTLFNFDGVKDLIGAAIGCFMIFSLFILNTLIVFNIKWRRHKVYRLVIDFALSLFCPAIANSFFIVFSLIIGQKAQIMWMESYVINFMIFMINEMIFFIVNYEQTRQKYETSQRLAVQLEYDVLRTQVNPHFLFNSFNILYSLTHIDIVKSQEFVMSLSRMYRYIMSRRDVATESLAHELEFLQSYVEVLKMLYFDCFDIEITGLATGYEDKHLIPYSLQLLVENVTKHNAIGRDNPMCVLIHITEEGLTVSNPIKPRQDGSGGSKDTGIGLNYLTKLYHLYGCNFEVKTNEGNFTVFVPFINQITLP